MGGMRDDVEEQAPEQRVVEPVTQVEWVVPAFATVERTLVRARRDREGTLLRLRMFPDHCAGFPLWGQGGLWDPDGPDATWLSTGLEAELRRWQQIWDDHCLIFEKGWTDPAIGEWWAAEGARLHTRVADASWEVASVERCF
jgi:hypothetical protein